MYKECIGQGEMVSALRQGIISLLAKPGEDPFDNWRPITLLTMDYKSLALVYAQRLKIGIDSNFAETQTGFMKKLHFSCNKRLILDLLDCANALILKHLSCSLIFMWPLTTNEHMFLLVSQSIWFWQQLC